MVKSIRFTKIKRLIHLTINQIESDAVSIVSVPKTMFMVLFCFFFFWFGFAYLGADRMIAEAPFWEIHAASAILAALCTLIVIILTAPIRAVRNERLRGVWIGKQFMYHIPQHAFTGLWTPADNGQGRRFTFDDVEPNSFVRYRIDVDGGGDRVETSLNFKPWTLPIFSGAQGNAVRQRWTGRTANTSTNRKREFILYAESLPDTVPTTIRVFILSFEVP
jgi:hypothetical protein